MTINKSEPSAEEEAAKFYPLPNVEHSVFYEFKAQLQEAFTKGWNAREAITPQSVRLEEIQQRTEMRLIEKQSARIKELEKQLEIVIQFNRIAYTEGLKARDEINISIALVKPKD